MAQNQKGNEYTRAKGCLDRNKIRTGDILNIFIIPLA